MNLSKIEMERLVYILGLQAESYEQKQQEELGYMALDLVPGDLEIEQDDYGNIYVTKGEADLYPCAVAHLDQVHDLQESFTIYQENDVLFAFNGIKQVGIGGDDKCGIFLCIEMLIKFDNVKVVFFLDEEIGCVGSSKCDIEFFKDCSFILQGDRNHATDDFISYTNGVDVCSKEFLAAAENIFKNYGYKDANGSCTDVGKLVRRDVGVSCANVACGYYYAHTDQEIISEEKLALCLRLFEELFENLNTQRWEHKNEPYVYTSDRDREAVWNKHFGSLESFEEDYDYYKIEDNYTSRESEDTCINCGSHHISLYGSEEHCNGCGSTVNIYTGDVIYAGDTVPF